MSARGAFATVDEFGNVWVKGDTVSGSGSHTYANIVAAHLNAAHADRVAAELEAAAESQIGHGEIVTMRAVRDALRSRAKAIREGGAT